MDIENLRDNPYLLLTPGPLSTTKSVKAAMLRDGVRGTMSTKTLFRI